MTLHINSPYKAHHLSINGHKFGSLLNSELNLYDADTLCIYLDKPSQNIIEIGSRGWPKIEDLDQTIYRAKYQLGSILSRGGSINIFCSKEWSQNVVKVPDGESEPVEIRDPITIRDYLEVIPENLFDNKLHGDNIEFAEGVIASNESFSKELSTIFRYKVVLPVLKEYEPLLVIKNTDLLVGYSIPSNGGKINLWPYVNLPYNLKGEAELERPLMSAVDQVITGVQGKLKRTHLQTTAPKWVEEIVLLDEIDLNDQKRALLNQMEEVRLRIQNLNDKIHQLFEFKKVLYTSGDELEQAVYEIFRYIGFKAELGSDNRVDLILSLKDRTPIVVEIKGLKGSAKESNAAQLEKWASDYYSRTKIIPKGLLVVNTFKYLPPPERTEMSFPSQMRPFMTQKSQAGLTTYTLLNYLDKVYSKSISNEEFYDLILETKGELN